MISNTTWISLLLILLLVVAGKDLVDQIQQNIRISDLENHIEELELELEKHYKSVLPEAFGDAEPDESVWATNDWLGTRLVPIYYVDDPIANKHTENPIHVTGFYSHQFDYIEIKKGQEDRWITPGCNVRQHEILHAWGYNEVELSQFNCPRPYTDYEKMQYNSTNIKHRDPLYEPTFKDSNPKMEKWN